MSEYPVSVTLPVALRAIDRARALEIPIEIVFNDAGNMYLGTLSLTNPDITLSVEGLRGTTISDDMTIDMWLTGESDLPNCPRHGIKISPNGCTLEYLGEDPGMIHVSEVMECFI